MHNVVIAWSIEEKVLFIEASGHGYSYYCTASTCSSGDIKFWWQYSLKFIETLFPLPFKVNLFPVILCYSHNPQARQLCVIELIVMRFASPVEGYLKY